ncbi:MAG: ATPase, partial [Bacteroidetes bacterium]
MNAAPTYRWYGTLTRAAEVIAFVEHQLEANLQAERAGGRKYPVCIWGVHGIGKTEIVRQIAERRGWPLVSIA